MSPDQILYLLEMAQRDDSLDELKWRFPDEDWAAAELRLATERPTAPSPVKPPEPPRIPGHILIGPATSIIISGIGYGGYVTGTTGTIGDIVRSTTPIWTSIPK